MQTLGGSHEAKAEGAVFPATHEGDLAWTPGFNTTGHWQQLGTDPVGGTLAPSFSNKQKFLEEKTF